MGISSSLYSSISGLNTMGNAMSVLGDNVANVNTISFKSSRVTFQDVLSQSVSTAAGAAQVGRGVTMSAVDGLFAQGSFESSPTPTDMAIGGQGFFMLRQPEASEADKYSRAGEFRFDQQGYLVNPVGYFAQGWEIDTDTGQRQGTLGDIWIGKNTPPVATDRVDLIVNLDQRELNEDQEIRLFDAWDARNLAKSPPSEAIDAANYEYTNSIKVYDSVGASHDLTVYFDRTTNDNQWEFLVTANPAEDQRVLDQREQTIYAPNERYNYNEHKGAGALLYGVINFTTRGDIETIQAWDVPPDAEVNPALNVNRRMIDPQDPYYTFDVNFTADAFDSPMELNFGARYTGVPTAEPQVLVSNKAAYSDTTAQNPVNRETAWASVFDANANGVLDGDVFAWTGYRNDGTAVSGSYTVTSAATDKVQGLLAALGNTTDPLITGFDATVSISNGKIMIRDNQPGESGMYVTSFTHSIAAGTPSAADLFGSQIDFNTSKRMVISTTRGLATPNDIPVISATTEWTSVYPDPNPGPGPAVGAGDTFIFSGSKADGTPVPASTFTINNTDSPNNTVQDLLDWLSRTFDCDAAIDKAGRLVLTDWTAETAGQPSALAVTVAGGSTAPDIFGEGIAFDPLKADVAGEDGSRLGAQESSSFAIEPLFSTQYSNSSTTIFQNQDGFASGFLQSVSVDTAGIITGHYSNGQVLQKAQVGLANFNNLAGLFKDGGNVFSETSESGAPVTGAPGTNGLGSISPNSLEQSNVDIGVEFVKLITTQRGFQANSKIISITDEMLSDLINVKR